jgi:pyrroline-5-carboxylate reductase
VIVLAVKPQVMKAVCETLKPNLKPGQLVVSIAAGITCASLQPGWARSRWCAACPTPRHCCARASAACTPPQVSAEQRAGRTVAVRRRYRPVAGPGQQLDAVTAVSGSGPAYFFLLIEAMTAAGEKLGLPRETAATDPANRPGRRTHGRGQRRRCR